MNMLRKNVIPSGTFAALALLTALTTSTPARALGASLSGAIHQIGLPVITTTIPAPVPSSKIVTLATGVEPGAGLFPLHLVTPEGEAVAGYVVPAGQDLVITSVEITHFRMAPHTLLPWCIWNRPSMSDMNTGWFQISFQRPSSTRPGL